MTGEGAEYVAVGAHHEMVGGEDQPCDRFRGRPVGEDGERLDRDADGVRQRLDCLQAAKIGAAQDAIDTIRRDAFRDQLGMKLAQVG